MSEFGFTLGLAPVVAVSVETAEHANDVRATFVGGHKAQVQAKRTLRFHAVWRCGAVERGGDVGAGPGS